MIRGESAGEMEGGDSPDPKRARAEKSENQDMEGGDSPDPKRARVEKSENQEMDTEDSHEEEGEIVGKQTHRIDDEEDQIDRRKEPKDDGGEESSGEMEGGESPDQSIEYYCDDGPNFLCSEDSDGLGSGPPDYHVEEFEKKILDDVDKVAADVYITQLFLYEEDPSKQIFLLKEPPADDDCSNWDYVKRTLPIYYKRMLPNTESALEVYHPYEWNRLPEIDLEYVCLFNRLRDSEQFPAVSWIEYNKSPSRGDYCLAAKASAIELHIKKLSEFDIQECLEDVFMDVDVKNMLKFEKDYDLYLLDLFVQKKWPEDMDRTYPPRNLCHGPFIFRVVTQETRFLRWMDGLKDRNLEKAELEKLLIRHREEVERECCVTRIRYVKFKRALAKKLRLISDDTD